MSLLGVRSTRNCATSSQPSWSTPCPKWGWCNNYTVCHIRTCQSLNLSQTMFNWSREILHAHALTNYLELCLHPPWGVPQTVRLQRENLVLLAELPHLLSVVLTHHLHGPFQFLRIGIWECKINIMARSYRSSTVGNISLIQQRITILLGSETLAKIWDRSQS